MSDFPYNWTTTANGFYTYTMYLPTDYLSGDGTWYFTIKMDGQALVTPTTIGIILNGIAYEQEVL